MLVVGAVLGVFSSVDGSVEDLVDAAGLADVEITGPGGLPVTDRELAVIDDVEGVAIAAPVIRTTVSVGGHRALLFGFNERIAEFQSAVGGRARLEGGDLDGLLLTPELARLTGASSGERLEVTGARGVVASKAIGVIEDPPQVNGGRLAVAILPVALKVSGRDGPDAVWVRVAEDADPQSVMTRLQGALGGRAIVASPRLRAQQVQQEVGRFLSLLLVMCAVIVVVAGFLVFNTTSMSLRTRRREFATLRAVGARRRQLVLGAVSEVVGPTAVASVLAAVAGQAVAARVVSSLPPAMVSEIGVQPTFRWSWMAVVVPAFVGIAAAGVAAVVPGVRTSRVSPVEAMRPAGDDAGSSVMRTTRRSAATFVAGSAIAGAGFLVLITRSAIAGAALFLVGGLVATFGARRVMSVFAAWVAGRARRGGWLAATWLERDPTRTWATIAGVGAAVAMVVTVTGLTSNIRTAVAGFYGPAREIDILVQATDPEQRPTSHGLDGIWQERLASLPGVADVERGRFVATTIGSESILVLGASSRSRYPIVAQASAAARRALDESGTAIVTSRFSRRLGIAAGGEVELAAPAGPVRLTVTEVIDFVPRGGGGIVIAPLSVVEAAFGRSDGWYEVTTEPTADADEVQRQVASALADLPDPAWVSTGEALYTVGLGISDQIQVFFTTAAWLAAAAAAMGVLNTLMLGVLERTREIGIVRSAGASRRRVRSVVSVQSLTLAVIGAVFGGGWGLVLHYGGTQSAVDLFGFAVPFRVSWPLVLWIAAAATFVAVVGGWAPGARAGRIDVIDAIAYE